MITPWGCIQGPEAGRIQRQTAWTLRGQAEGGEGTRNATEANSLESQLAVGMYMMRYSTDW